MHLLVIYLFFFSRQVQRLPGDAGPFNRDAVLRLPLLAALYWGSG